MLHLQGRYLALLLLRNDEKKMMLCPYIPLVSAYIYQVKNDEYANLFCHNKISGGGAVP